MCEARTHFASRLLLDYYYKQAGSPIYFVDKVNLGWVGRLGLGLYFENSPAQYLFLEPGQLPLAIPDTSPRRGKKGKNRYRRGRGIAERGWRSMATEVVVSATETETATATATATARLVYFSLLFIFVFSPELVRMEREKVGFGWRERTGGEEKQRRMRFIGLEGDGERERKRRMGWMHVCGQSIMSRPCIPMLKDLPFQI